MRLGLTSDRATLLAAGAQSVLLLAVSACDGGKLEVALAPEHGAGTDSGPATLPAERHAALPCPLGACPGAGHGPSPDAPRDRPRVVIVSVDGLGGTYLGQRLATDELPSFARWIRLGASTLDARTDFTHTITLPNHTSIITGRPVSQVDGEPVTVHHGYTANGVPLPDATLHNAGNPALSYVASVFDVAHDHGLSTCLYAGKPKFVLFAQSYDEARGAPDLTGEDDGRSKLDRYVMIEDSTLVEVATAALSAGECDLTLLHIPDLDTPAGHGDGWGSDAWFAALERVDSYLESLLTALVPAGFALILTADHGGEGYDHSLASIPENYRIPFLVVAPGVPADSQLYELLGGRRAAPGESQPSYTSRLQPVRNGDAANLALEFLGLPPVPGSRMRGLGLAQ